MKIKDNLDKIQNQTTKKYLAEVVTNIESKNYRSAIVVLYTTMLYDILKQLEDLRDFYDDKGAKDILLKVHSNKKGNPTASSWEKYLIEEIYQRGFITKTEEEDLKSIQRLRNYGSHPIVENDNNKVDITLREIKESEVILAQENAFDIIFSRQLGLGKKYVKEICSYAIRHIENNSKSFRVQFSDKYLKRLNKTTYQNLFKLLYKAAFVLDDSFYMNKREAIVKVLTICVDFNYDYCIEVIKENDCKIFSNLPEDIVGSNGYQKNNSKIFSLITFIKLNPGIWEFIPQEKKKIIRKFCDEMFILSDPIKNNLSSVRSEERSNFVEKAKFVASNVFLYDDFPQYFKDLSSIRENVSTYRNKSRELTNWDYLNIEDWQLIVTQCEYFNVMGSLKEYIINNFKTSFTFAGADKNVKIITSIDFKFSQDEVKELLESMDKNSQFYASHSMNENLTAIASYFNRFPIKEMIDKYSNLKLQ